MRVVSLVYNWVMTSYANQRDGAEDAERILDKMEEDGEVHSGVLADTISLTWCCGRGVSFRGVVVRVTLQSAR